MKDYTLSELKITCKEMHDKYGNDACKQCAKTYGEGFSVFCNKWIYYRPPMYFPDIEPRAMIELPCKECAVIKGVDFWLVHYRNSKKYVDVAWFNTEGEADKFLAELKKEEGVNKNAD